MQTGLAAVLHDAAVLHRLADFIEEYCKEQERSQRYTDESGEFFRYAENVAAGIKLNVHDSLQRVSHSVGTADPSRIAILRRNILTFRDYLRLLHVLIKPAADAHTLSIPAPLIDLACRQLREIEGMQQSRIVVLLTPQLMYFQRPHTEVKKTAQRIERLVSKAKFPKKLGFIEVPYSQGPGLFNNLAIYHEISHFVYEELPSLSYAKSFFSALESATERSLTEIGRHTEPQESTLAKEILESWTQEIFCDLLALRLVGPAFSFALVEILNLVGPRAPDAMLKFGLEHPAPACRFSEHVRLLRGDKWWEAISEIKAEQITLIGELAAIKKTQYTVYKDVPSALIAPFVNSIIPTIRKLVDRLAPKTNAAAQRFKDTHGITEACLGAGVVPHTCREKPLDPVSIINAAFAFYLTTLPQLVTQFEGEAAGTDVRTQGDWIKKLEDWTTKAIENSQMRARFEGGQGNGSV